MDKDVLMRLVARDEDLHRALERSRADVEKLKSAMKDLKNEGKATTQETTSGFTGMGSSLAAAAGGVATMAAAFGVLKSSIDAAKQSAADAGRRITGEVSGREALLSLRGTEADYRSRVQQAEKIRNELGGDAAAAFNTVFQSGSAGMDKDTMFLARLKQVGFNPVDAISATQKLQSAFGGEAGAGDARMIAEKILAAASRSPTLASEFAKSASVASVPFASIGGRDEELLAILSRFSEPFKTPDVAAQKIASLATQLGNKRGQIRFGPGEESLAGMALIEALPRLADEGKLFDEGGRKRLDLRKFLSESNAIQALEQFQKDRPIIDERLGEITRAQAEAYLPKSGLAEMFRIRATDPKLNAATIASIERARREAGEEDRLGSATLIADALIDAQLRRAAERGESEFTIAMRRRALGVDRYLSNSDQSFIESQLVYDRKFNTDPRSTIESKYGPELTRAIERLIGALEKNASATTRTTVGPTLLPPNQETGRGIGG